MARALTTGLLVAAISIISGCAQHKAAASAPEPVSVRVQEVKLTSFSAEQRFAATTSPQTQIDLAFRSGGLVTFIYKVNGRALEPGDRVTAGTVLARLRTLEYAARVNATNAQLANAKAGSDSAQASISEAQAAFSQASEDLERGQALFQVQAMTKSDLDGLRARRDVAEARLTGARAAAMAAESRVQAQTAASVESQVPLSDTVIRSPFDGVIVARRVEEGSSVAPGTLAYALADMHTIKLTFGVGDSAVSALKPGLPVEASLEALGGMRFNGKVLAISPVSDPSNRTFEVTAQLPNEKGLLRAGMVASVTLGNAVNTEQLSVPLRAIRRGSDVSTDFAVLVVRDGRALLRHVKLGQAAGSMVAVTSGLTAGELVIEDASARVDDGDPVTVLR